MDLELAHFPLPPCAAAQLGENTHCPPTAEAGWLIRKVLSFVRECSGNMQADQDFERYGEPWGIKIDL